MNNFNVMALDCATKSGWASLIDGNIESGVQDFSKRRGESNGMLFLRFNKWLKEATPFNVKVIAFEQAHHRGGAATEICVGLTTRVMEFAVTLNAEYMAVKSSVLKKFINNSINISDVPILIERLSKSYSPSVMKKIHSKIPAMVYFEQSLNRIPIDDNEADAYSLLRYTMQELGL